MLCGILDMEGGGMQKTMVLLGLLLISTSQSAAPQNYIEQNAFMDRWNRFVDPMNEYVMARRDGIIRADKLREAIKAWRSLEREQEWDRIR